MSKSAPNMQLARSAAVVMSASRKLVKEACSVLSRSSQRQVVVTCMQQGSLWAGNCLMLHTVFSAKGPRGILVYLVCS